MKLRRLGWAGVELESAGETLVIDHLIDPGILRHFLTDESDALIEPNAGDTMWHGAWWQAALRHGAFDVVFMPANGVELAYPHMQPAATTPGVMTPEQAVDAAAALRARKLVPIHFNRTFEHPKYYRPVADAAERIETSARARKVPTELLEPGDWIEVSAAA